MKNMTKKFTVGVAVTAFAVVSLIAAPLANAQSAVNLSSAAKDCDANAVMYCGASTTSELQTKYKASASVQTIYAHFGISAAEVNAMGDTAVAGSVTKSGTVLVGSKVVAKNALTGGRQNIAGSTKVTKNGVTFYTRTPSVSFQSSSLPAFVVMKDGVFQFAILAACGNPVKATPITKPPVKPEQPETPQTPETPTPKTPETPKPVAEVAPAPQALPETGPGQVLAAAGTASVVATAGYYIFSKRRNS